ncbi:MAG: polysaccharide export protein [Myxococcales bacterium]|jgi:protein involved in polysaccharide export with SLBB domain|nr:polysaccharide export protein [Myxococcales bacterium]
MPDLPARCLTRRRLCAGLLGGALLVACGGSNRNTRVDLEPPTEHTTLGPGDIFNLEIVGEKDLPTEYQVASDGTVTVPYIHELEVAGLEPQEVAALVRKRLMERKILTDPSVVVTVKEYRSKRVTLLGQVQKPGSFPLAPDMTLLQAISLAGGMTSIAQASRVNLTRKTKNGTRTVVVNVEEIYEGRAPDIPLQAGDSVYVRERIF